MKLNNIYFVNNNFIKYENRTENTGKADLKKIHNGWYKNKVVIGVCHISSAWKVQAIIFYIHYILTINDVKYLIAYL